MDWGLKRDPVQHGGSSVRQLVYILSAVRRLRGDRGRTASKPQRPASKGPTSSCKASPKDFISGQMFRHTRLRETFHLSNYSRI